MCLLLLIMQSFLLPLDELTAYKLQITNDHNHRSALHVLLTIMQKYNLFVFHNTITCLTPEIRKALTTVERIHKLKMSIYVLKKKTRVT